MTGLVSLELIAFCSNTDYEQYAEVERNARAQEDANQAPQVAPIAQYVPSAEDIATLQRADQIIKQ